VRALRTEKRRDFALAGLCLGVGMYTYNSFMIVPVLVVLVLLAAAFTRRRFDLRANLANIAVLALVAAYVFIPLGRYIYEDPARYVYRAATRITAAERPLPGDVAKTLLDNAGKVAAMFNYRGDALFMNNVPLHRELGFLAAVLFVLGLAYLVWRWRMGYNATVLLAFGIMLLPTVLSVAFPGEVPNVGRAIGALPSTLLFAAVALSLIVQEVRAWLERQPARTVHIALTLDAGRAFRWELGWKALLRGVAQAVLAVTLATEAAAVYPLIFTEYARHLPDGGYPISLRLAQAIDSFADDGESYIKLVPYWYDEQALRVQLRRADPAFPYEVSALRPDGPPLSGPPGKFMVILHPSDEGARETLYQAFPQGIALTHVNYEGWPAFITFYGVR